MHSWHTFLSREVWWPAKPMGGHYHYCTGLVCFNSWCNYFHSAQFESIKLHHVVANHSNPFYSVTQNIISISRRALCLVCPQMWRGWTGPMDKTLSNSTHIGTNTFFAMKDKVFGVWNHLRFQNSWTSALKSLKNRTYLKIKSMGSDTRRRPVEFYLQHTFRIYGPRLYPYLTTNWKFIWPNPGKRWAFQIWMGCSDLCAGKAPKMRGDGGRGSLSYAGNINRFSYSARLELSVFLYFYLFAIFTQIYLGHP